MCFNWRAYQYLVGFRRWACSIPQSGLRSWLTRVGHEHALRRISRTHLVYTAAGCSIASVNIKTRGTALEAVARQRDRDLHPNCTILDPPASRAVNGALLAVGSREFDWLRVTQNGEKIRVEHKSAQLRWNESVRSWSACWIDVKPDLHDELQLSFFTPSAIYTFQHDGIMGVSTVGKRTTSKGCCISVVGTAGERNVDAAEQVILNKISARSELSKFFHHDLILQQALRAHSSHTQAVFSARSCPLSELSSALRGLLLEDIARVFDGRRHPHLVIEDADVCFTDGGRMLGPGQRPYDWIRSDPVTNGRMRIEHKAAQLTWNKTRRMWNVCWEAVKPYNYDELQLTIYSPNAVRTFVHDGLLGFSTTGKATWHAGLRIVICGPTGEHDLDSALRSILNKLCVALGPPILELT